LDRIEFHYTPKHGSWLNLAETATMRAAATIKGSAAKRDIRASIFSSGVGVREEMGSQRDTAFHAAPAMSHRTRGSLRQAVVGRA
jgi:hypothetical protein